MPKLGADMSAGKLVSWRKKPGDAVKRGEIIASVDTDKGVIDIETFDQGVLESLLVEPGTTVPVGTPLATIRSDRESPADRELPAAVEKSVRVAAPVKPAVVATPVAAPRTTAVDDLLRVRISPSARQRARELNVDPLTVKGTGHGGAISREDIERAAVAQVATTPQDDTAGRQVRMRQAIAAAMSRANQEIPHYYLSTTINLKPALDWLAARNEGRPIADRMLYSVLLLKSVALALREVPELNAFWQGDRAAIQSSIHLGVAVSMRGGGLIAPALHDVDRKPLEDLMGELRDLVNRVRSGGLRSSELSDPTITVTSLGEQGVETVYGVIYPPQVALVGFGKIVERPWIDQAQIAARPLVTATLAGDHRATDGHRGGIFLSAVERLLQEPSQL